MLLSAASSTTEIKELGLALPSGTASQGKGGLLILVHRERTARRQTCVPGGRPNGPTEKKQGRELQLFVLG